MEPIVWRMKRDLYDEDICGGVVGFNIVIKSDCFVFMNEFERLSALVVW